MEGIQNDTKDYKALYETCKRDVKILKNFALKLENQNKLFLEFLKKLSSRILLKDFDSTQIDQTILENLEEKIKLYFVDGSSDSSNRSNEISPKEKNVHNLAKLKQAVLELKDVKESMLKLKQDVPADIVKCSCDCIGHLIALKKEIESHSSSLNLKIPAKILNTESINVRNL